MNMITSQILCNIFFSFIILFILSVGKKLWNLSSMWSYFRHMPHRESHLILGDIIHYRKLPSNLPIHKKRTIFYNQYTPLMDTNKLYVFWLFWEPLVMIRDYKAITEIFSGKHLLKGPEYDMMKKWIGDGLISTSNPSKWRARRRLITPAFHFKILEDFVPCILEHSISLLKRWEKIGHTGGIVDLRDWMPRFVLDMLIETIMGLPPDVATEDRGAYLKAVHEISELVINRAETLVGQFDFLYNFTGNGRQTSALVKVLRNFTTQAIRERINITKRDNLSAISSRIDENFNQNILNNTDIDNDVYKSRGRRRAFMDTLIHEYLANLDDTSSDRLTIEGIREEVDTFIFAGHDTTSASLIAAIYLIGNHPEIQERLYEEVSSKSIDEQFDYKTIGEMKYLDACVKESLRLFPPVPMISKRLGSELNVLGYQIPPGTRIIISIFHKHRDPEIFRNPDEFRPNRFMADNGDKILPFTHYPFSAGPRNCIGQKFALLEIKIFIILLLKRFEIQSLLPMNEIEVSFELILRYKTPMQIKLIPRNLQEQHTCTSKSL
ncbi:cytochrome P450 4c3-like [Brevipalpus obovatus]|uniref:cytochrome P450 4c3-like n=1 Tax=Brevipalpus obovatus TaxID=246614 RepID=UPI003D9FAB56